ncbi:MAG: DMT family transporter [Burkholderiales bacterium]
MPAPPPLPNKPQATPSRATGWLLLLVTSVGWGFNWPAMKLLLQEWPPLFARGTAGLIAALALVAVALLRGERLAVPRQLWSRLAASAFCSVFAWMGFTSLSLRWLSAGQAALLVYTMPVWATMLAWPVLGQRPTPRALAGLLLCMSGVAVLVGQNASIGAEQLPGVLFALGAALMFALGTITIAALPLPPFTSIAWQLLLGCLPMVVLGLLFEKPDFSALSPLGFGLMAYMTIGPMGLCYLSWFAALRRVPPQAASMATLLTPMIGVSAAAALLGEPFGARQIGAMVLTLGGVALALRRGA